MEENIKLGDLLLKEGLINSDQLLLALIEQEKTKNKLGSVFIKLGFVAENVIADILAKQLGITSIDISNYDINESAIKLVPVNIALKYKVVPIDKIGDAIILAMADPSNIVAIDEIKFITGLQVEPVVSPEISINKVIEKYYQKKIDAETEIVEQNIEDVLKDVEDAAIEVVESEKEVDIFSLQKEIEDAPVVKLVNLIISDAVKREASDIHIEPYEKQFRVRYRIDGILYEAMSPPLKLKPAITSRLKIMADLDIAERRLPQDGRIKIKVRNKTIDLRVSTLPTLFGEKVVMRILDKSSLSLDLTKLGFEEIELRKFEKCIGAPYGIILITGPTGSGKTTTLYSALNTINVPDINIMTAEDPVEYNLMGINQVQTKAEIGLTFASSLRSFLRQDPDIIMVGEIRDYETAEISIKAALTGHLVFSTLHTNDAPSAINRLLNMGIEPFLISSSLLMSLAQRLVRKVCQKCKTEVEITQKTRNIFEQENEKVEYLYKGKGCEACNNTGYKGRIAIYEIMPLNDAIRELILKRASSGEVKKKAVESGMTALRKSAILKCKQGLTTIEEVVRVTFGEDEIS
ncbi:MAG: type IV-A pilus assembly ATPase PilB [bacterium]